MEVANKRNQAARNHLFGAESPINQARKEVLEEPADEVI